MLSLCSFAPAFPSGQLSKVSCSFNFSKNLAKKDEEYLASRKSKAGWPMSKEEDSPDDSECKSNSP